MRAAEQAEIARLQAELAECKALLAEEAGVIDGMDQGLQAALVILDSLSESTPTGNSKLLVLAGYLDHLDKRDGKTSTEIQDWLRGLAGLLACTSLEQIQQARAAHGAKEQDNEG